jgi:hypothetical protein
MPDVVPFLWALKIKKPWSVFQTKASLRFRRSPVVGNQHYFSLYAPIFQEK